MLRAMLALGVLAAASGGGGLRPTNLDVLRTGLYPVGPTHLSFRCAGAWAPIQAKVSGFVIGNCRGGTPVVAIGTDACAVGCIRGAASEGGSWQAVALPRRSGFGACGWINTKNRLVPGGSSVPDRCAAKPGPDLPYLESYIARFDGRRVPGIPAPNTEKYRGMYLWTGRFTTGPRRGQEGGGMRYPVRLSGADTGRGCTAYANIQPWRGGQRVRSDERVWTVHDGSRNLDIRYLARFRARDERGRLGWWVNAHSRAPTDRERPWGFVSAECLFGVSPRPSRDRAQVPAGARVSVAPGAGCGFAPVAFHLIVRRRGLSCAAAKKVLRELRGAHDLAPMACGAPAPARGVAAHEPGARPVARDHAIQPR